MNSIVALERIKILLPNFLAHQRAVFLSDMGETMDMVQSLKSPRVIFDLSVEKRGRKIVPGGGVIGKRLMGKKT